MEGGREGRRQAKSKGENYGKGKGYQKNNSIVVVVEVVRKRGGGLEKEEEEKSE